MSRYTLIIQCNGLYLSLFKFMSTIFRGELKLCHVTTPKDAKMSFI
jgi:hypothetical protein